MFSGSVESMAREVTMKVISSCLRTVPELPNLEGSMHTEMFLSYLDGGSEAGDSDIMLVRIFIYPNHELSALCTLKQEWKSGDLQVSFIRGGNHKWDFGWQIDDNGEVVVTKPDPSKVVDLESAV